jgi:hypothetical protein
MAWYITVAPAVAPIRAKRSRRLIGARDPSDILGDLRSVDPLDAAHPRLYPLAHDGRQGEHGGGKTS